MNREWTAVLMMASFLAGAVLEAFVGWLWLFAEPVVVLVVSMDNTVGALFVEPLLGNMVAFAVIWVAFWMLVILFAEGWVP